ncbi:hypothetical protein [Microbacterium candidum]|uniref:DUF4304 domain-containing protein n=1 Tax=Microbacterium candidum TaxID=3041922 RepID=A0ABT7MV32_9MICO|nr:hypothetical protein [Microbacterium sp. ASV49]MDL9978304.1 hypothetical protein [Microbacterium sp. ASV49]
MSGSRKVTAPGVVRLAVELGLVPSHAEIRRDGSVQWKSETFSYIGFVYREDEDLAWTLWVGDANFPDVEGGMLSVPIMGEPYSMPWPTRVDDNLTTFLRNGLGEAARFVKSREDLCLLLASRDNVRRGHVTTRFFEGNHPARFVGALVIARDMGRADLEADVLGKLAGLEGGRQIRQRQGVGDDARS